MIHIIINNVVTVLAIVAFAFTPFTAFAADMWEETPNLNDDTELSFAVIKPAAFINRRPLVNMWAETPDLNAETEDYDVILDDEGRFLSTFIPEMYIETPAIDEIFIQRQLLAGEDSFLAEGR